MSYTYAIQPPAGLGLLQVSCTFGHRKEASKYPYLTKLAQGLGTGGPPGDKANPTREENTVDDPPKQTPGAVASTPPSVAPPAAPAPGAPPPTPTPTPPATPRVNPQANPGVKAQNVGGTPQNATAPAAPQQSYGLFNRFSDIFNFIKHMWTMLKYRSGARAGTLKDNEWAEFQDAAKGLGNNRTFKDIHNLWWGSKEGAERWKKYEGLHDFTKALPAMHRTKAAFARLREKMPGGSSGNTQDGSSGGLFGQVFTNMLSKATPDTLRKTTRNLLENDDEKNDFDTTMKHLPYALQHGFISKDEYDKYPDLFKRMVPYPVKQQPVQQPAVPQQPQPQPVRR